MYIAHKNTKGEIQTVKEHSEATAELCRSMAVPMLKELCYALGLFHDVGKYQKTFQNRIDGMNVRIEHSVCGAMVCKELINYAPIALLAELCIAGHHSGIPDCGARLDDAASSTLYGRMKRETEDFSQYKNELAIPHISTEQFDRLMSDCESKEESIERFAFLVRYCFSCLTDADSLDTAKAMDGQRNRSLKADFEACLDLVKKELDKKSTDCQTDLQKARAALQAQAYAQIQEDAQIYLMHMPTGSGKTLCSIRCALERAIACGKKRIIYVIPYNSIIEQTADVLEKLFSCNAQILRHQSTFSYEDAQDWAEDDRITAKLACENWDAQIIITTVVQFFESIYSNKRGKLRKLHNMADSILVFDEAHLMPRDYLQPCLRAIAYITHFLNSEAIFLTATMPDFAELMRQYALSNAKVKELIPDKKDFVRFEKCRFDYVNTISDEKLMKMTSDYAASLIVAESIKSAREIYSMCTGECYHLSTHMTAFDRKNQIAKIRQALTKLEADYPDGIAVPPERRITVVSTSLIEAGVDFDFHAVFRELAQNAGLDNILQAGGRCNREGRRKDAVTYVFARQCSEGKPLKDIRPSITGGILKEFEDISCTEAVKTYYERLYFAVADEVTAKSLGKQCKQYTLIPFATYSRDMKMIDESGISIAVERDDNSRKLIAAIRQTGRADTRALQLYLLSVKQYEFDWLLKQSVVDDFGSGVYCLTNADYYNEETGIQFEGVDKYMD